jgi:hypothetical protein
MPLECVILLTFDGENDKQNATDDEEDAGGEQVHEVLENVLSIAELNDRYHRGGRDERKEECEEWPNVKLIVERVVNPRQEEQVSETESTRNERNRCWNERRERTSFLLYSSLR